LRDDDVVWYIGDRHKDVIAALAANEAVNAKVIPFAYGLKAAVAILEKGLAPDHIIMNYTDFAARIYPVLKNDINHYRGVV
jgi:phosphoglycolate phosphatase